MAKVQAVASELGAGVAPLGPACASCLRCLAGLAVVLLVLVVAARAVGSCGAPGRGKTTLLAAGPAGDWVPLRTPVAAP